MTAQIASYLSNGYSAMQVLQMIERTFPNIARGAKSALQLGRSAEDIVKLISKLKINDLKKIDKNAEQLDFTTPLERANKAARSQEQNPLYQGAQDIAKLGAIAVGGLGAAQLVRGLNQKQFPNPVAQPTSQNPFQSTLQPSIAQPQEQGLPHVGQTIPASALQSINPQASQTQQPISPQQPTPQPTPQSASPTSVNSQQSVSLIDQLGIGPQIQTLKAAGNNTESISAAVSISMKPHQRKWLDEQIKAGNAKSLPDLITDYLGQTNIPPSRTSSYPPNQENISPMTTPPIQEEIAERGGNQETFANPAINEKISPEIAENVQKQPVLEEKPRVKPQKGELVATPSGDIGEIKSERNGKALVDINGKLHQTEAKDLEMPNEELIKAVENLLNLPEIEKSAVISSLVYRPSKKEMFVKFHNGERYVYEDVDEEEIRPIAEAMGIPVTTGQNIFGAWEKGKQDSRGAALIHGIIRNAKYAKDNEGKTWEKLETKYDRYKKLYKQPKRKRKE